jgi:hypothetical protein
MARFLSEDRKIIIHAAHEQVGVSVARQDQPSRPVPLFPPCLWIVGSPHCHAALDAFQATLAEMLFHSGVFGDTRYVWEETLHPVVHDSILLVGGSQTVPQNTLQTIRRHHQEGGTVLGVALGIRSLAGEEGLLPEIFGVEIGEPLFRGRFEIRPVAAVSAHPVLHGVSAFMTETVFPPCRMVESTVVPLLAARQGGRRIPIAWAKTRGGLRRFGTVLGTPFDFHKPGFLTLLRNAVLWTRGEI